MMTAPVTISFIGTDELKRWLEEQARSDDRSVSYVLRQILEKERRQAESQAQVKRSN